MKANPTASSSSETINVLAVIDTAYVKANYNNAPSQDPANPTNIDHNSEFMICDSPRGIISGQAGAALNFRAYPGDTVSFRGMSIEGNSDDAVIIYRIDRMDSQPNVFNRFVPNLVNRTGAAQPDPNTEDGLPALQVPANFSSLDSKVQMAGAESFWVCFALYTLVGGELQEPYGYFRWDPTITVR